MTTAAIFCQADAYDTKRLLMGRQMAGMGFVRAMARYAGPELYCYAANKNQFTEFQSQVEILAGVPEKCVWIPHLELAKLATPGTLYFPSPHYPWLVWQRRYIGPRNHSICGITHSICTASVLNMLGEFMLVPVESWDALICTSKTAKTAIESVFASWSEYLAHRFGGGKPHVPVQMPIIPLGVDCEDFAPRTDDAKIRKALREELGVGKNDIAVLFVGRMAYFEKAHPMPMYLALEAAAKQTGKTIHLIQAGRFNNDTVKKHFVNGAKAFCPTVKATFLDGGEPELHRDLWVAADIFVSLSDNIQETFGLTPLEAMAAGLPVVVSDWDGYRDTVRHGIDGFAVPTLTPPAPCGDEITFRWFMGRSSYEKFVGHASQCTAVDVGATTEAFVALINDPDLRRRMGEAGRARAAADYDWRIIIAAYQELWRELGERRAKDAEMAPRNRGMPFHPLRPDPFAMFSDYPTSQLSPDAMVARSENAGGLDFTKAAAPPMNSYASGFLLPAKKIEALLERLAGGPMTVAAIVGKGTPAEILATYRTLCWLAKMGLVAIRMP